MRHHCIFYPFNPLGLQVTILSRATQMGQLLGWVVPITTHINCTISVVSLPCSYSLYDMQKLQLAGSPFQIAVPPVPRPFITFPRPVFHSCCLTTGFISGLLCSYVFTFHPPLLSSIALSRCYGDFFTELNHLKLFPHRSACCKKITTVCSLS